MSGAEPALLGVGVLCNALQILTFAKDTVHVYRNIRDARAPDPKLDSYLKNAKTCFNEMNQTAAQIGPLGQTQQQIVDVGKKRHEQLLHSLLLDQVCSQSQAAEITSLQAFQHLEGTLRNIISHGSTKVSDLVTALSTNLSSRVADEHATTRIAIQDQMSSLENTVREGMSQSIAQLRQELLDREQDKAFEKQYEQLLSSLQFPEMNSRRNHISNNYPGTFNWILCHHTSVPSNRGSPSESDLSDMDSQTSEDIRTSNKNVCRCLEDFEITNEVVSDCFPCWLESDSNIFWVSGKPASGKSSLMKFLASNFSTGTHLRNWRSNVRILTHSFWKPGKLLQRNVEGMVLSLLDQVLDCRPGLCRMLCEAQPYVRHKRSHSDWSLDELTDSLVRSLEASPEAFCIFLDGMDEAKELEHLPWPDWTNAQVIHKLLKDITLFVGNRLVLSGLHCRDRDRLVHEITKKAEGVFLWVSIVLGRLNQALRQGYATIEKLRERLEQTPSDLATLYAGMWDRIGDDGRLPSVRTASYHYFSLTILTQKINEYLEHGSMRLDQPGYSMSSLLVMATAIQDSSIETKLSKSRNMKLDELVAMCSRAENKVKVVCGGLLEVINHGHDPRLLAAHLVKAQYIYLDRGRDLDLKFMSIDNRCKYRSVTSNPSLQVALTIALDDRLVSDFSFRDSLLDVVKSWQLSRLLCGHLYWYFPKCFHSGANYLELELLEATIYVALSKENQQGTNVFVERLLSKYVTSWLVDALPVILRALSRIRKQFDDGKSPFASLLIYILGRFQSLDLENAHQDDIIKRSIRGYNLLYERVRPG
ncbi:hypothetical protein FMEXI_7670 [Fusarium mexicanum]|uniref:Nephrocystin 3-like N-terminal domain-containing protein n=1 Tax=Fusarium mexicanum TaxID=751941 RepID=A0A8H5MTN6_9HYPO|nr:hypothetical protein FMEXI_7670 [Fusarium mexicanum]